MYSTQDIQAIATAELYSHLEQQVTGIAPEIPALVPVPIKVERVSMTRNASNTPYMVYRVGSNRCCTFIRRRVFVEVVQKLLLCKELIDAKVVGVLSSPDFGLTVKFKEGDVEQAHACGYRVEQRYIASGYVAKFFGQYNQVALERTMPQDNCGCGDLYNMCLHQVARVLQPRLEVRLPKPPVSDTKSKAKSCYNLYARGRNAAMQNWKAYQQYKAAMVASRTAAGIACS